MEIPENPPPSIFELSIDFPYHDACCRHPLWMALGAEVLLMHTHVRCLEPLNLATISRTLSDCAACAARSVAPDRDFSEQLTAHLSGVLVGIEAGKEMDNAIG